MSVKRLTEMTDNLPDTPLKSDLNTDLCQRSSFLAVRIQVGDEVEWDNGLNMRLRLFMATLGLLGMSSGPHRPPGKGVHAFMSIVTRSAMLVSFCI